MVVIFDKKNWYSNLFWILKFIKFFNFRRIFKTKNKKKRKMKKSEKGDKNKKIKEEKNWILNIWYWIFDTKPDRAPERTPKRHVWRPRRGARGPSPQLAFKYSKRLQKAPKISKQTKNESKRLKMSQKNEKWVKMSQKGFGVKLLHVSRDKYIFLFYL